MDTIVFPGSFDPLTLGHLDLIKRASKIANKVVVVVVETNNKLDLTTRVDLINQVIKDNNLINVEVDTNKGLIVDYLKKNNYHIILRGIRNNNDYQYEQTLELNNKNLKQDIETIYMLTHPDFLHISSSVVWEILKYQDDVSNLTPSSVSNYLKENYENL